MRVLHVELPRGLTLAVRPWRAELHHHLSAHGHTSAQLDLNGSFWRWCLRDEETETFGRLLDLAVQPPSFNRTLVEGASKLAASRAPPSGSIDFAGLQLERSILEDSAALLAWAETPQVLAWCADYLGTVEPLRAQWDLVTLSVGSSEELAFGAALSAVVRRWWPDTHVALTHHQWENFSLAPRIERLAHDGALIDLFDSAFIHAEFVPDAAVRLCEVLAGAPIDRLTNTVTRVDGAVRTFGPAAEPSLAPASEALDDSIEAYLDATTLPRHRIYLLDALVRNDCYYGRCTFCVQNVGYRRHQHYGVEPELRRVVGMVEHFATRFGVRSFGFVDQAIPRNVLSNFVDRLQNLELDVRWSGRMIFDDALDDELFARAAQAGCRELLFGIESTSPVALVRIGKPGATPQGLRSLLERLDRHRIDVVLSFIWGLPGQSDADFLDTTAVSLEEIRRHHERATIILNAFELFEGSAMATQPELHGLREVRRRSSDLGFEMEYVDAEGRAGPRPLPERLAQLARGPRTSHLAERTQRDLELLAYTTVGLLYRWDCGRWLLRDLQGAAHDDAPWFGERDELVLGANGYLGHNLACARPAEKLILSSRGLAAAAPVAAPYVREDLTRGSARLRALRPRIVWVAARPVTDRIDDELTFLATLQSVLHGWAEAGHLRRVIIFSTQLVCATPSANERVLGGTEPAPELPYELAKAQLEVFGAYLARRFELTVDVVRLPLLAGGHSLPKHEGEQFLSRWKRALDAGARWTFASEAERAFGNSWAHVDDLVRVLAEERPAPGFRARTAKSGDFTYAEMVARWPERSPTRELSLVRSTFYVEDELGLPSRILWDVVSPEVRAARSD